MSLERLVQDLRYGFRWLRRSPGFSVVAILTLGLGIGANTAIFSVVDAVLLRPLPFAEPERLVRLWESLPRSGYSRNVVNPRNYLDWRERSRSFEQMAALHDLTMNLVGVGEPVALPGMRATPELFAVLRVSPFLGRGFLPEDAVPGGEQSVILSHGLWQGRFGGDRSLVGRKITVNGAPSTVVGVLPPAFSMPNSKADLWLAWPLTLAEAQRGGRFHGVVARLKPGVNFEQAQQELAGIAKQLSEERPAMNKGWSAEVVPFLQDATERVRLPLLVLLAAVGFVLLIACANVANLLLMRSMGRLREIAVRAALGAGRGRILQQLLSESLLLALAGCAAGVAAGYWGLKGLLAMIPAAARLPRVESIQLDGRVLAFALGISVLTAFLFGLIPAFHISRLELHDALKQGSPRSGAARHRIFRQTFVVTEIALALLLLVGAGLMVRSLAGLIRVDPGFETERVLTMQVFASPAKFRDSRKRSEYWEQILTQVRGVPGVEVAGSVHFLPLTGLMSGSCFSRADQPPPTPGSSPGAQFLVISPGYFRTMGMALLSGRDFSERDRLESPGVVVVNQAFAQRFFSGEEPIGKRLNLCWNLPAGEIVGIVADARQTELRTAPRPTIFVANPQSPMYFATLVARARSDPRQIARSLEAAIHRVDPEQPVSDVRTMEEVFSRSVAQPRFQVALLLVFAGLAVVLAAIGVYGVVSYSVSQRTREVGIRVALGASRVDVARLVVREGLVLAGIGVAIGLAAALALTRVLRTLLFEVAPTDPITLAAVSCLLLVVVAVATFLPARRAARVDPMTALRYE